jgi:trimethylamine--corrinoid protein Co-methyltransferase
MGLNTPATVAGAVTVGTIISFVRSLVGHALAGRAGVPNLGSVMGITSKIDPRTARVAKAGPEACLCALAACDMARFYGVPPSIPVGFQGQGKETASFQTGYEKGALLPNVMAGGTRVGAIGCISQPEHIFSPMQLLLDAELVSMFRRFYEGFEVTLDTIGYDAICESSQTGIFLDHPHTGEHYRRELWQTTYSVHGISYNDWQERPEAFGYAAARKKALEILESHRPNYLADGLRSELRRVVERAASEVMGESIDGDVWSW